MKVKLKNLREFTYQDSRGFHTIVGQGEVPADLPEVQQALKTGYLEKIESPSASKEKEKTKESRIK